MARGVKVAALAAVMALTAAGPSRAALITQTLDFDLDFSSSIGGPPPPYSSVAGTVSFTYDSATTTTLVHQAVDSVSFTTPSGLFHTTNVFFDLRLGPDLLFPPLGSESRYEFSIYFNTEGVFFNDASDWLLRLAGVGLPGDEFDTSVGAPVGFEFLSTAGVGTVFYQFYDGDLVSTTELVDQGPTDPPPNPAAVPAPAAGALALMGLGMLMATRRRRVT